METDAIKIAATQGVWAVLSMILIFYILKSQEKRDATQSIREDKYQTIISTLTDKLGVVEEIKNDIAIIKAKIKI